MIAVPAVDSLQLVTAGGAPAFHSLSDTAGKGVRGCEPDIIEHERYGARSPGCRDTGPERHIEADVRLRRLYLHPDNEQMDGALHPRGPVPEGIVSAYTHPVDALCQTTHRMAEAGADRGAVPYLGGRGVFALPLHLRPLVGAGDRPARLEGVEQSARVVSVRSIRQRQVARYPQAQAGCRDLERGCRFGILAGTGVRVAISDQVGLEQRVGRHTGDLSRQRRGRILAHRPVVLAGDAVVQPDPFDDGSGGRDRPQGHDLGDPAFRSLLQVPGI